MKLYEEKEIKINEFKEAGMGNEEIKMILGQHCIKHFIFLGEQDGEFYTCNAINKRTKTNCKYPYTL
jgi:hypothetical protein